MQALEGCACLTAIADFSVNTLQDKKTSEGEERGRCLAEGFLHAGDAASAQNPCAHPVLKQAAKLLSYHGGLAHQIVTPGRNLALTDMQIPRTWN
jgi:hypothetical protein